MLSPRHFLDAATEWRKGVWRRWLISYLVPPVNTASGAPEQNAATTQESVWKAQTESVIVPKAIRADDEEQAVNAAPPIAPRVERPQRKSSSPSPDGNGKAAHGADHEFEHAERAPDRFVEQRRADVRARFDALSDRLLSVEDTLDSIARRLASRENLERRSEQRLLEVVENMAETCERQTQAMENSVAVMMRLEQRILRVLHNDASDSVRRQTLSNGTRNSGSTAPAASEPFFWDERKKSRPAPSESGDDQDSHHSGYSIRGNLGEMSLPTVFSMLELERHTGRLIVKSEDGPLASFELVDGAVISSRFNESDLDPVNALRDTLKWTNGSFWLVQSASHGSGPQPRSVGSLLLEATRQNDEANADRLM
jgi:hypothetical protein